MVRNINLPLIRNAISFLGLKATLFLMVSVLLGLMLFAIEVSFAYSLQAFLLAIGLIDPSLVQIPPYFRFEQFDKTMIFVLVVGTLRGMVQGAHFYFTQAISEVLRKEQRSRIVHWAFHSPSVSSGRVLTLFHEHVAAVAICTSSLQSMAVYLPTSLLLWATLFSLAKKPTLIATTLIVILAYFVRSIDNKIKDNGTEIVKIATDVNKSLTLHIKNLLLMQICGTELQEEAGVRGFLSSYLKSMLSYIRLSAIKYALPQMLGAALICTIATMVSKSKAMTPSLLVSYFYLFIRFVQTLAETGRTFAVFAFNWPALALVVSWWSKDFSTAKNSFSPILIPKHIQQPIAATFPSPIGWQLDNVSFAYELNEKNIFSNLNIILQPGKTLVVTGPSGAGKSTLISLLLGTIKPDSGTVLIVAADDKKFDLSTHRKMILQSCGYVGADSFFIEGTVLDNIKYGLTYNIDESAIIEALRAADCHFVFDTPQQLHLKISEQGQGLSAGQKQRLSLARALLRNPKVLILDEATSNLDEETENRLIATLSKLRGEMTMIIVTHRSSLLRLADQHLRLPNINSH